MKKKLIYVSCLLIVMSLASNSMAGLMGYWSLDEGSGTVAADGSGNGHDGTVVGTPAWVQGNVGNAMQFGTGGGATVINCGQWDTSAPNNTFTAACWVKFATGGAQYQGLLVNRDGSGSQNWGIEVMGASGSYYFGGSASAYGLGTLPTGTWAHLAVTFDGTTVRTYLNGAAAGTSGNPRFGTNKISMVRIGASEAAGNIFQGAIDEVYIFNEILALADITKVMNGDLKPETAITGTAKLPKPGSNSTGVSKDIGKISWTPGEFAFKHNVFIGTNFADVNTATLANPNGTTVYEGLDVNSISLARLPYETTYYWRVDEVNAPSKPATIVGHTWKFTTELPGTAIAKAGYKAVTTAGTPAYEDQEPNSTCNGKGLDANDMHSTDYKGMWLAMGDGGPGSAWIQYEFDKVYMLYDLRIWNYNEESPSEGFGVKDANISYSLDGVVWTNMPTSTFNIATGDNTCTGNTLINMNHAVAKFVRITFLTSFDGSDIYGLSEVRFRAEPTYAQTPSPSNGTTTRQAVNVPLRWTPGRYSVQHYVYISVDANDVNGVEGDLVTPIIVTDANVIPGLDLNKKYYWRVDEVNIANAYPTWTGTMWNFSTVQSLLLDGFETGYGNTDTNAVWATWIDGYNTTNNGATISKGLLAPGLSTLFHGGARSAPVTYDNTGTAADSWITAQSTMLQLKRTDWSIGHPTALVIWFRGDPNNIPDQLYAKVNSTKVLYTGEGLNQSLWRPFVIDLTNINLANITSLTIGLEKKGTGGKGIVYFDDIALYGAGAAPVIAQPVSPGNTGLVASYSMENNVLDLSGNAHNGTIVGTPTYVTGMAGRGMAMLFNGSTDAVNIGQSAAFNFEGSFTVSVWARISAWSTGWGYTMVGNRGESDKGGWQLRRNSNNRFAFTTRGISNDDMTSNANPPPLNEWVNFTCVYDSAAFTKTIYIDGVLDRTVTLTGTTKKVTATTAIDTYIGARAKTDNTGPENFFNGQLDEVRIYDRALSAGEAAYLGKMTP